MQALMQKLTAFFMTMLAFFGIGTGTRGLTGEGESITAQGATLTVVLNANPSTGYHWSVARNGNALTLREETYRQRPGTENLAGAGGTQIYVYSGEKAGLTTLTFRYLRPWEGEGSAIRVLTVTVCTDSNGSVHVLRQTEANARADSYRKG